MDTNVLETTIFDELIEKNLKVLEESKDQRQSIQQIRQNVYDFIFDRIKDAKPKDLLEIFNIYVAYYNTFLEIKGKSFSGSESEIINHLEKLDLLEITTLDGESVFEHDENNSIKTHPFYEDTAEIIFLYLANSIAVKEIKLADLGNYLPDNRGLDANYEFANGLIARTVLSFWEKNKQFHNWHSLNCYIPSCSKLEKMIFNNQYNDIYYIEDHTMPEKMDAVIVNVPYISVPYQWDELLDMRVAGNGIIDFTRLDSMLEDALKMMSDNGLLFLNFQMLDVYCNHDGDSRGVHPRYKLLNGTFSYGRDAMCPSLFEWPKLYNIFSKYGLSIDSVISTYDSPTYYAPSYVDAGYFDNSGIIILQRENTVIKPFYSVINITASFYEMEGGITLPLQQRLLKAIVHGEEIQEKDMFAEYIDNRVEFNGFLDDAKNKDIYYKKQDFLLSQGFKEVHGKDLIKTVNSFDIYSNSGFEEGDNSIFLPVNKDLFSLIGIRYSLNEFEQALERKFVKKQMLDWEKIPWYNFILQCLDDSSISGEKKEHLNNVFQEFNNEKWSEHTLSDITRFGFEVRNNAICYEDKVIQELDIDYDGNNFALRCSLEAQVLNTNVFEAVLNPKVVLPAYLKLYFSTHAGWIYFRDLNLTDETQTSMDVFLNEKLVIPTIELQKQLLQYSDYIDQQKRQLEALKDEFYDYIGGGSYYSSAFKLVEKFNYNIPDPMQALVTNLPQPIASILYLDSCEDNIARKNINYFHLFEAVAHFHATVSLSMIKQRSDCQKLFDLLMTETFLTGGSFNRKGVRADFGLWTTLLLRIEEMCTDKIPFDKQINNELRVYLDKARKIRNKQMGHAPRWSNVKEKEVNTNLKNLAHEIISCFSQLYRGYKLVTGPFAREESNTERNTAYVNCYKAMGPNPRFGRDRLEIKGYTRFLDHRLYLMEQGTWSSPVELLPLINYMALCEDDDKLKSLGYFHEANLALFGNRDNRFIVWCSYDCGDNSILNEKYSGITDSMTNDLINFLTPYWKKKIN